MSQIILKPRQVVEEFAALEESPNRLVDRIRSRAERTVAA
jgi:hypothetical protein